MVYHLNSPPERVITYASVGGMGLGLEGPKAAQERGDQSISRPLLDHRVAYLVSSPSLEEHV